MRKDLDKAYGRCSFSVNVEKSTKETDWSEMVNGKYCTVVLTSNGAIIVTIRKQIKQLQGRHIDTYCHIQIHI